MKLHFNPDANTVEELKQVARCLRDLLIKNESLEGYLAEGIIESEEEADALFRNMFRTLTQNVEW